jgi:hypothetical protein
MDGHIKATGAETRRVSRRWVLRSTVGVTAGVAAAATATFPVAEANRAEAISAPDHDPVTGEIFDRDRHHHWDTV